MVLNIDEKNNNIDKETVEFTATKKPYYTTSMTNSQLIQNLSDLLLNARQN